MLKRVVLVVMVGVLSLGWAGLAQAGGHRGGRGHHGGHYKSYGHHGGHYNGGHHGYGDYHDYYYGALLAPIVLHALLGGGPARAPAQAAPTAYIDQQGQSGYWYYCPDPAGYHPYIKECRQDWMQVVPSSGPPR